MCGISGFSLRPDSTCDRTTLAHALLAVVAERGDDASGAAWMTGDGSVHIEKQVGGASRFMQVLRVPDNVSRLMLHVRDFTKGRPANESNNHPIRHGRIVGVHNGRIANDEYVFSRLQRDRAELGMTVDSEAIFAALDASPTVPAALEMLRGSLATGWFDEARPNDVFLARGHGRPLWVGTSDDGDVFWCSTLRAVHLFERLMGVRMHARPLRPGTILRISGTTIDQMPRFRPDPQADWLADPTASPAERRACLALFAG